jgi:hypothetical protein
MKVIDGTQLNRIGDKGWTLDRARERLARSWNQKEFEAQDLVAAALQKALDNRHFLFRNLTLEGPDVPIPLILVGPLGVRVIYASVAKGVFRARDDAWEELDNSTQAYKPARPNLITRVGLMARSVQTYLANHGQAVPDVEPVLFFLDPGVHIDLNRPSARIVLVDALDRFAAGLAQAPTMLEADVIQNVINAFVPPPVEGGEAAPEVRDAFSFQDMPKPKPARKAPSLNLEIKEPSFFQKLNFDRRQWTLLAILVAVNILILVGLVMFILLTT